MMAPRRADPNAATLGRFPPSQKQTRFHIDYAVMDMAIVSALLEGWAAGRSLARGLPKPVPDRGGLRVDTNSVAEVCRWIFPRMVPGLVELAQEVSRPGYLLKVCGSADDLRMALPPRWHVEATGYFMNATDRWESSVMPAGYTLEVEQKAAVTRVQIRALDGDLAGCGYAAETANAFVYDRIVTAPRYRRKGLGRALMSALQRNCRNPDLPGLLVATEDGHALYRTLGWRVLSTYSTALIPIA
jgi:GNAT superfamily N-acetyltransferase